MTQIRKLRLESKKVIKYLKILVNIYGLIHAS